MFLLYSTVFNASVKLFQVYQKMGNDHPEHPAGIGEILELFIVFSIYYIMRLQTLYTADIHYKISTVPHPRFSREGDDLWMDMKISLREVCTWIIVLLQYTHYGCRR